jgi:hypothetical protein
MSQMLADFREDEIRREQEEASRAWESKVARWEETFRRHDPIEENYHHTLKFLVEGFLPQTYTILLASESKEGKTALLDALCLAVVKGQDFAGRKVKQGGVLWAACEENPKQRQINLLQDPDYQAGPLDIYTAYGLPPLHHEDTYEMLCTLCLKRNIRLLVIDPLAGATGFHSLQDGHYIRRIFHTLNEVAFMCDLTVIITHQVSSLGNFRLADSIQIQAAAGMMMHYSRRKLADDTNLVTLTSKGRGPWANQTIQLRSTGPLHYEPYIGDPAAPTQKLTKNEQAILAAVGNGHKTTGQVSDATGINYSTCRNLMAKMQTDGRLELDPNPPGIANIYLLPKKSEDPV